MYAETRRSSLGPGASLVQGSQLAGWERAGKLMRFLTFLAGFGGPLVFAGQVDELRITGEGGVSF